MTIEFGLDGLVHPLTGDRFRSEYWGRKPFVAHHSRQVLGELCAGLRFDSLGALIEDSATQVSRIWFTAGDKFRDAVVPIAQAASCYEGGMTLFFDRKDRLVRSWFARLERDLKLPASSGGSASVPSIFASPAGRGSTLHFDRFEVFTLQLRGKKTWWVSPSDLAAVTANWTDGDAYPPAFDAYRRHPISVPRRKHMQKFVLRPGSFLYVPRGHWHETEAHPSGESASLNFAFGPPSRADVFLPLLRFVAEHEARWREQLDADPVNEGAERAVLADAIRALAAKLPDLADDYWPVLDRGHRFVRVRLNRLASITFDPPSKGGRRVAHVVHRGASRLESNVPLTANEYAVCEALLGRADGCDVTELAAAVPSMGALALHRLLARLGEARLLTRVGAGATRAPDVRARVAKKSRAGTASVRKHAT